MRLYLLFNITALALFGGYFIFTNIAFHQRPLNEHLAYDALVRQLGESLSAGKERIRLAQVDMLQRPHEVIFMGEGNLNSSRKDSQVIPLIEKLKFRYIVIVSRDCLEWDAKCYRADELELSAETNALPMI